LGGGQFQPPTASISLLTFFFLDIPLLLAFHYLKKTYFVHQEEDLGQLVLEDTFSLSVPVPGATHPTPIALWYFRKQFLRIAICVLSVTMFSCENGPPQFTTHSN